MIGNYINVAEWEITVLQCSFEHQSLKGAPNFDMTMHASCTVVSTGDEIAHQML